MCAGISSPTPRQVFLSCLLRQDLSVHSLALLELTVYARLTSNSQRFTSLCLLSSGTEGVAATPGTVASCRSRGVRLPDMEAKCQLLFILSLMVCCKPVPVLTQPAYSSWKLELRVLALFRLCTVSY